MPLHCATACSSPRCDKSGHPPRPARTAPFHTPKRRPWPVSRPRSHISTGDSLWLFSGGGRLAQRRRALRALRVVGLLALHADDPGFAARALGAWQGAGDAANAAAAERARRQPGQTSTTIKTSARACRAERRTPCR